MKIIFIIILSCLFNACYRDNPNKCILREMNYSEKMNVAIVPREEPPNLELIIWNKNLNTSLDEIVIEIKTDETQGFKDYKLPLANQITPNSRMSITTKFPLSSLPKTWDMKFKSIKTCSK